MLPDPSAKGRSDRRDGDPKLCSHIHRCKLLTLLDSHGGASDCDLVGDIVTCGEYPGPESRNGWPRI